MKTYVVGTHRGTSNEYPQHMLSWRNKKNIMWIPPLICSYDGYVWFKLATPESAVRLTTNCAMEPGSSEKGSTLTEKVYIVCNDITN